MLQFVIILVSYKKVFMNISILVLYNNIVCTNVVYGSQYI